MKSLANELCLQISGEGVISVWQSVSLYHCCLAPVLPECKQPSTQGLVVGGGRLLN